MMRSIPDGPGWILLSVRPPDKEGEYEVFEPGVGTFPAAMRKHRGFFRQDGTPAPGVTFWRELPPAAE